jgi:hypothetical protein
VYLSRAVAVALAVPAFLVAAPASSDAAANPRLAPTGLGRVHFGMDRDRAEASLGAPIAEEPGINGCSFWDLPGGVTGTSFHGRLGYILLAERGPRTTRGIEVGDGLTRLRHRYRGRLHGGRSGSLGAADLRLFTSDRTGGANYEIEFDVSGGKVAFISAGTRHTIETFGECA